MTDPLSIFGLVCIAGAITGGGLKALGVELPVISSIRRQAVIAVFGLILLAFSERQNIIRLLPEYKMVLIERSAALKSGTGEDIEIECGHWGTITFYLKSLDPSKNNDGNNVGVHVRTCPPERNQDCSWAQLAQKQTVTFKCDRTGQYNLNIFNFDTNPPVKLLAIVKYPG